MKEGSVKFGKIYQQMVLSHDEDLFQSRKRSLPNSQHKLDALKLTSFYNDPKMNQTQ
jgi:hypothetical protein